MISERLTILQANITLSIRSHQNHFIVLCLPQKVLCINLFVYLSPYLVNHFVMGSVGDRQPFLLITIIRSNYGNLILKLTIPLRHFLFLLQISYGRHPAFAWNI